MRVKASSVVVMLGLLLGAGPCYHREAAGQRQLRREAQATKLWIPHVAVSSVTVEPKEVHETRNPKVPVATITVQIAHEPVTSPQTVTLAVGTYSTSPATGVSVRYEPASKAVVIPASPQGVVNATVTVKGVNIGASSAAKVVIAGTLLKPSAGIRIGASMSPDDWRTTLTITRP